jgi:hypothetical protein
MALASLQKLLFVFFMVPREFTSKALQGPRPTPNRDAWEVLVMPKVTLGGAHGEVLGMLKMFLGKLAEEVLTMVKICLGLS